VQDGGIFKLVVPLNALMTGQCTAAYTEGLLTIITNVYQVRKGCVHIYTNTYIHKYRNLIGIYLLLCVHVCVFEVSMLA
jgi:hypothetical protein